MATQCVVTEEQFRSCISNLNTQALPPYLANKINELKNGTQLFTVVSNFQAFELLQVIFTKISHSIEAKDPWSNSIDPIGYLIGASLGEHETLAEYALKEQERQQGKTIDNYIGYFHQGLLRIAVGDQRPLNKLFENEKLSLDVEHGAKLLGAEIKNKWNTTKGNSRPDLYNKLNQIKFPEKTHFAEIISKPGKNKPLSTESEKYKNVIFCNGAYIYEKVASLAGLTKSENVLKDILENFPILVWIYSHVFNNCIYETHLQQFTSALTNVISKSTSMPKIRLNTAAEGLLRTLESVNSTTRSTEQLAEYRDTLTGFNVSKNQILKPLKEEAIAAISDLIFLLQGKNQTKKLSRSIEKFLSEGDDNLAFFQNRLIGHLFSSK